MDRNTVQHAEDCVKYYNRALVAFRAAKGAKAATKAWQEVAGRLSDLESAAELVAEEGSAFTGSAIKVCFEILGGATWFDVDDRQLIASVGELLAMLVSNELNALPADYDEDDDEPADYDEDDDDSGRASNPSGRKLDYALGRATWVALGLDDLDKKPKQSYQIEIRKGRQVLQVIKYKTLREAKARFAHALELYRSNEIPSELKDKRFDGMSTHLIVNGREVDSFTYNYK